MAPQGLSCPVGVEITSTATRPPASPWGAQDTDPAYNAAKPAVGGTARPRRTSQAWDRDGSYGAVFRSRLQAMAINEVLTAPRSPWRNAYAERVIGTIRRECLDHVMVLSERHLRRILSSYFDYYHRSRTRLSLVKDCPEPRPVHPPDAGKIIAFPQVGGLHHRYERLAA